MSDSGPYALAPDFEKAFVTLLCANKHFYGRIGPAIDPECLSLEEAKRAVQGRMPCTGNAARDRAPWPLCHSAFDGG